MWWRIDIYEFIYFGFLYWCTFRFRFLFSAVVMDITDIDADDYLFAFLIFWPIALIAASVFQLINFIRKVFEGDY